jgi:hypothetical protein
VLFRKVDDPFTRPQRVTTIYVIILSAMAMNAFFYDENKRYGDMVWKLQSHYQGSRHHTKVTPPLSTQGVHL